jgi:hypothetical protein
LCVPQDRKAHEDAKKSNTEDVKSAEKKIANNIARLQKQAESGATGANLPLQPMETPSAIPKATKRYNPQTKKVEAITGE